MTSDKSSAIEIDARGTRCPIPLLRAKRACICAPPGSVLEILATDPEAPIDIGAWCADEGHALVAEARCEDFVRFTVRTAL